MEYKISKCNICFEEYNTSNRIPKQLSCCNRSFCLKCLQDVYRYCSNKIVCPICRSTIKKNPNDLKINKELLENKSPCPNCSKNIRPSNMKIIIDNKPRIVCSQCHPNLDVPLLKEYLDNFIEESTFYINLYSDINREFLVNCIELQAKRYVNEFISKLKAELIKTLQVRIANNVNDKFGFNVKDNSILEPYYALIKHTQGIKDMIPNMKRDHIPSILSTVEYYMNNIDTIKTNYTTMKNVVDYVTDYNHIPKEFRELEEKLLSDIRALDRNKNSSQEKSIALNNVDTKAFCLNQNNELPFDTLLDINQNIPLYTYEVVTGDNFSLNLHKTHIVQPTLEESLFSFTFFDR